MSERLCQFFIRGRCLRDVCEFQHPADLPTTAKPSDEPAESEEVVSEVPPESGVAKKASGFESDEDVRPESDNESIASGFTEKPVKAMSSTKQPTETSEGKEKPTEAKEVAEKPVEINDDPEEPTELNDGPAETNDKGEEEAPSEADGDLSIIEVSSTIKKPSEPAAQEAWNFATAAAAAVTDVAKTSTPLLPRRAAKTAQSQPTTINKESNLPGETRQKSIRRDTKGFELLEDYFSDSETDKSTDKTLPMNKNVEEAADENSATEHEREPDIVEDNSPQNPTTISDAAKKMNEKVVEEAGEDQTEKSGPAKSAVDELTRDWDDDEASQADAGETIESIENFMQGNNASEVQVVETVASSKEKAPKQAEVETAPVVPEKSVYDLDPDELDDQPASKTNYKGEPKPGLQSKRQNLIKKEGVTKIGNNVYYYTGKEDNAEGASEGEDEDEEENEDWEENDESYDNGPSADTTNDGDEKNNTTRRTGLSYALGRRKHNTSYVYGARSSAKKTRRCGECEGCNREECAQCPTCLDKPKFGGSGLKKQACVHRVCIWKNPSGKKVPGVRNESTLNQSRVKEPVASPSVSASPALRTRTTRRSIAVIASATKEAPQPEVTVAPPTPTQAPRRGRPPGSSKRKLELEKKSPTKKLKTVSNGTEEIGASQEENGQPPEETSQDIRSVPFINDAEDNREVLINCFAPYDEHKWTNIGKKKEGVDPHAVQYARALRPPYHLLSFLRIQGNTSKGSSSTNRNTMVFIVLQGQITVELHRTKLVAKAGDSFYIPPRNFYNLINDTSEVAELTLMQFQYDGPLTSLPAGSQSGVLKPADD